MKKDEFARELMLQEVKSERGRFITQRIVDRLVLFYSPLFEWKYLHEMAVRINAEKRVRREGEPAAPRDEGFMTTPLPKVVNG